MNLTSSSEDDVVVVVVIIIVGSHEVSIFRLFMAFLECHFGGLSQTLTIVCIPPRCWFKTPPLPFPLSCSPNNGSKTQSLSWTANMDLSRSWWYYCLETQCSPGQTVSRHSDLILHTKKTWIRWGSFNWPSRIISMSLVSFSWLNFSFRTYAR